jgi:RES domain-containing protein
MEVFRISKEAYSHTLSSSGSANRWNTKGQQVIYIGSSRSLSSLELVVHRGSIQPATTYKVMVISIMDDDYLIKQVQPKDLPSNWRSLAGYSALQKIGSTWYNSQETVVLKVPSAIIVYEYNYIINTEHPDFSRAIQLVRTEDYFWDSRLL